mgnify:CR=1 FL=1
MLIVHICTLADSLKAFAGDASVKRFITSIFILLYSAVCHLFFLQTLTAAQVNLGEDIDCTDVRITFSDDPTLTQEERIHLMDQALSDSLNKFEFCQSIRANKEVSGAADSGASGSGAGDGNGAENSIASAVMSGTDSPSKEQQNPTQTSQEIRESDIPPDRELTGDNGKLPEDIPAAANDDVLAAQIRHAAENETDPAKKKLLWDEYRKYKGLPPQK